MPGASADDRTPGFETLAIHAGQSPDEQTGAVVTPIHLSSTFAQRAVGEHKGFEYARTGNPTRASLETTLSALEGAAHGFCFASGMAAEDALLRRLVAGDHLIIPNDAYGGTFRLVDKVLRPTGISYSAVDLADAGALESAWQPRTRLVWIETPSNPMLNIVDIGRVASFAHDRQALCVVDNTFATPYLQQPLALGADAVVHSSTKYLGGHSDVVGGFVATSDDELATYLAFMQNATGAVPSPFDCYLVQRGIKTLAVRLDRQCANAAAVAGHLAAHDAVGRVFYPGLESHGGHEVASRQMRGIRGDGLLHHACRRRRRARGGREDGGVHTRRVARGGRVAGRAPSADDARLGGGFGAVGRSRALEVVCRPREPERPALGPRSRPRRRA